MGVCSQGVALDCIKAAPLGLGRGSAEFRKPSFRAGLKNLLFPAPIKPQLCCVERVVGEEEFLALGVGQAPLHEVEVERFVAAVKLVAHNGMAQMRQVNANLMFAPGQWAEAEQ